MSEKNIKLRWYLLPFAIIYGLITSIRNRLFDFNILKSSEFDIPVITVGNISTGGTGKTPHVEYIVKLLSEDFKVATLSRGYRRKTKGFIIASKNSTVYEIGDEPKQIKQKFNATEVVVDEKRVRGINKILEKQTDFDLHAIILDDGFQHRYVQPGISILLIDYNRPITKDYLLPVGNLRERAWRKKRANMIIVSKSPKEMKPIDGRIMEKELNIFPYQSLFFTTFKYNEIISVFGHNKYKGNLKDIEVLLITGIAMPHPLIEHLNTFTDTINHLKFPDHYNYKNKDIESICSAFSGMSGKNKIIITTEKDAMRIQDCKFSEKLKNLPLFYIPIEVEFLDEENEKYFRKIIIEYVRKNKRHSKLHN
ncbi:MAG: tetraacyldisaccharide 4'-kinase [Bacteroidota bacterium]